MKSQWFFRFRRSKLGAKIDQKSKFFVEFLAKRLQDAPRRPQDVPKMLQDTPRRLQVGPQRRAKSPKTPPDPRKTETQKRSEAQSIPDLVFRPFGDGFWSVFEWIWEGFGDDFGSLKFEFSWICGSFTETIDKYLSQKISLKIHEKNSEKLKDIPRIIT